MKNPKQNAVETDAARERTASESEKLRRNQKVREKGAGLKSLEGAGKKDTTLFLENKKPPRGRFLCSCLH